MMLIRKKLNKLLLIAFAFSIIFTFVVHLLPSKVLGSGNGESTEQEVRVISINLDPFSYTVEGRAKQLIPILFEYDPDSIGTQENSTGWAQEFDKRTGEKYKRVGLNFEGTLNRLHCPANFIYYNSEKYTEISSGTVWMKESTLFPEGQRRNYVWIVLENKETGIRYVHINTHLDVGNPESNKVQMKMMRDICERFISLGYPVFVTGDFNTSEGSESYHIMVDSSEMYDSKYLAEDTMSGGTFHSSPTSVTTDRLPIDFCFVYKELVNVKKYEIIDTVVSNSYFLSDHNGLFINATVKNDVELNARKPDISLSGISIIKQDINKYKGDIYFSQADDIRLIDGYIVKAIDPSGKVDFERIIPSRNLDLDPPDTLRCTLTALKPNTKYIINITPKCFDSSYSETYTFETQTK